MEDRLVCFLRTISGTDCRKRGCMVWQTSKPHPDMVLESQAFNFCGCRCWLALTFNAGWLVLSLKFKRDHLHLGVYHQPTCRVTVYLEESSGYILPDFSNKIIFLDSNIIWCCHETYVLSLIPSFWSQDHLRFLVVEDNAESTLSLKTQIDDKTDLGFFFTYAGACLDAVAEVAWEMLNGPSDGDDVELKCGDRVFYAHKTVLSSASPVFAAMLSSDMTEGRTGVVDVHGVDPDVFEQFVACLYSKVPQCLTPDSAMQLYQAGDMYAVQWLMKGCSDYLQGNLIPGIAWDVMSLADIHDDHDLKQAAETFIKENKVPLVRDDDSLLVL